MNPFSDEKIIQSWANNVSPWVKAIEQQQIDSRKLVTDQAIIDAVTILPVASVLDLGCGEGWLVRALSAKGLSVSGMDAIPAFIDKARELGAGNYQVMAYEELGKSQLPQRYDAVVCNFSLLGQESVEQVFANIPQALNSAGYFIVQTLHPCMHLGDALYCDGWREGTWVGFSDEFSDPAPWYYRTLSSWFNLFHRNGFIIKTIQEPINPHTNKAASLIIVGCLSG